MKQKPNLGVYQIPNIDRQPTRGLLFEVSVAKLVSRAIHRVRDVIDHAQRLVRVRRQGLAEPTLNLPGQSD